MTPYVSLKSKKGKINDSTILKEVESSINKLVKESYNNKNISDLEKSPNKMLNLLQAEIVYLNLGFENINYHQMSYGLFNDTPNNYDFDEYNYNVTIHSKNPIKVRFELQNMTVMNNSLNNEVMLSLIDKGSARETLKEIGKDLSQKLNIDFELEIMLPDESRYKLEDIKKPKNKSKFKNKR